MWKTMFANGVVSITRQTSHTCCGNFSKQSSWQSLCQMNVRRYSLSQLKLMSRSPHLRRPAKSLPSSPKSKEAFGLVPPGGWLLLIIPVSTLGLGVWQVYRWQWKLKLIEEMRQKSVADPIPLPTDIFNPAELEYCKMKVNGSFDYSKEFLIGPRPLMNIDRSSEKSRGVFSGAGTNGFLIITPFKIENSNESILVNRGWVDTKNTKKYRHVEGPVEVVGIFRKTEHRAPFMSKNRPGQTMLHYRDVATMAEALNTSEIFLDLYSIEGINFSNAREQSIPVPRQTRVTLRNEHVSYFITWFSLSAITSLMWHRRFIRGLNLL